MRRALGMSGGRALPWAALTLCAAAAAASWLPGAAEALFYQRSRIEGGEWWRAVTGHLVNPWPALAALELAGLLVLGVWMELRSRRAFAGVVAASACTASACIWLARPDLELYAGSSGIASGLFAALGVTTMLTARRRSARMLAALALVMFAIKVALECAGLSVGRAVGLPAHVEVVAIAHAAGGLAGAAVAWVGIVTNPAPYRGLAGTPGASWTANPSRSRPTPCSPTKSSSAA